MNNNMFNGIKSKPNIIGNAYISTNITQIFYNLFNIYINVTIIEPNNKTIKINQCILGEKEKCKKCSEIIPENCLICNDDYYKPFNEYNHKVCLPCNKIEHCSSCYGYKNYIICSSCEENYYLDNNNCLNIQNLCIIGKNEKCKDCNDNPNLRSKCKTCNEGYYLPKENQTICESCENIENCAECAIEKDNLICFKCKDGFDLLNNECREELCIIGKNEKCSECRTEKGRKKECYSCNEGFNISDNNPLTCKKCSINNCKKCSFINGNEISLECNETYAEIKNDKGYISSCECPYGNITSDGNNGNWISLSVIRYGEWFELLNLNYIDITPNDIDLYINDKLIPLDLTSKIISYNFDYGKTDNIKINIKKTLTSMESLFDYCYIITSVSFLPGFDSSKVTSMRRMYYNTYIETN